MKPIIGALSRTAGILLGGTIAVVASAQQPNKLHYDSTPAYQEHSSTPPAAAAASASDALKTTPGKTSAGKGPAPDRPNGLGMDAGAGSMSKKP
ncbi:hypothetical protein P9250_12690 [Caballeronia sp. LP006]|uniref:hypothetical protein n=1 Tax=unclassified Caballeronia TaxID=2646786 RepID=UPI001FD4D7D2|nr:MULTISPECIES: hypothetical protein [unclassified Caballeronia]MDR5775477.1 hypothetical protein [Caballeronia sp. LZ002]MDR5828738.1 hypothetical protein [Caballeronia sp. LP006]MDR5850915.1 hypothetical protein [Caballeronia sp. LZ003]